ncbi:MAG: membrane protein insertion efficiency factor YidD [Deltaproteobacteria bacterium]|nr:membrane protein insertion efficiency factor YidD [Deltaproteobacteria bacterium]
MGRQALHFHSALHTFIRNCCRYTPSCSQYAIIAIRRNGPIRGIMLALVRILRCVPPLGGTDWPRNHGGRT